MTDSTGAPPLPSAAAQAKMSGARMTDALHPLCGDVGGPGFEQAEDAMQACEDEGSRQALERSFREWHELPCLGRPPFWEWLHGRREK